MLFVFVALTLALFLLPLLPSLRELKFATDTQPLQVIREYDIDITHFANGFKAWLEKHFSEFFTGTPAQVKDAEGKLEDNTFWQIVGDKGVPSFSSEEIASNTMKRMILSSTSLWLTGKMFFAGDIYGRNNIQTAAGSQFRAMLAEGDIKLGENCSVLRWAHSHGTLSAGTGCSLFGRASADDSMTIGEDCQFERLNAPKIQFGENTPPAFPERTNRTPLTTLPNTKDHFRRRWLIDGDLAMDSNQLFDGDIVASRNITIGAGSHVKGSLKSNQNLYLASGVRIDGAIVSSGSLHIEPGCIIAGPVIAEDTIHIEEGSVIGTQEQPTTVSAPVILVASGVTAYGTVWAEESAMVIPVMGSLL